MNRVAFDSHKRYTQCSVEDENGRILEEGRIRHLRGEIRRHLSRFPKGGSVAVETIGNWYWIVDEIEQAGMMPRLGHARKAKWMLGAVNKSDMLLARGLNKLQRDGTLPTVWIPPGALRDLRDVARTRMGLARERTRLKNRIHSVWAKYGLQGFAEVSHAFVKNARALMEARLGERPPETRYTSRCRLEHLDEVERRFGVLQGRMKAILAVTPEGERLLTATGIAFLLALVIVQEVGDGGRFATAQQLASYAGTTPSVHASGGMVRYGPLRSVVNHFLKWAFSEAANAIGVNRVRLGDCHVVRLYERIRHRKGHATAIGAVARHLAEATYWMWTRQEGYRQPQGPKAPSRKA